MSGSRILVLLCLVTPFSTNASVIHINFQDAVKKNMIKVHASSKGGYIGNCLALNLENKTKYDLDVYVEPGLIFVPSDTTMQNLVAVGDEKLAIKPGSRASLGLQTFCGKSYAHSPKPDIQYRFWKQADPQMVSVLQFVKQKKLYDGLGQSAVWMFTNNHSFSGVYDYGRPELSYEFVKHISKVTGKKIPDYHIKNKQPPVNTGRVYSSEIEESYVDISWNFDAPRNLHIAIYNEDGSFHKMVRANETISKEGHKVIVRFSPVEYKKGNYIVRLYDDENTVYVEKSIQIQHN